MGSFRTIPRVLVFSSHFGIEPAEVLGTHLEGRCCAENAFMTPGRCPTTRWLHLGVPHLRRWDPPELQRREPAGARRRKPSARDAGGRHQEFLWADLGSWCTVLTDGRKSLIVNLA